MLVLVNTFAINDRLIHRSNTGRKFFFSSEWDRCRMKCPVEKPIPPTRPGAQLIGDANYPNWEEQLWEGEKIYYKCDNASLVLDNTKDKTKQEYQCQLDGEYNTPNNLGHSWPECTEQPVDPSMNFKELIPIYIAHTLKHLNTSHFYFINTNWCKIVNVFFLFFVAVIIEAIQLMTGK